MLIETGKDNHLLYCIFSLGIITQKKKGRGILTVLIYCLQESKFTKLMAMKEEKSY